MKLWLKNKDAHEEVTRFTAGNDREMDLHLARFDVLGSIAHATMLKSIGLLSETECNSLLTELKNIYQEVQQKDFTIPVNVEDIHSYVELVLTERVGETGKKIHSGRSRNDQVLVDIKLLLRHEIEILVRDVQPLFDLLLAKSEEHRDKLLPGYTHLQLAMPSSFGLWFAAYAESLVDDVITLQSAYKVANKNPLGSGAGYGSSFPLNRQMTTALLGFETLHYNVVYAQMGRGKTEKIVAHAMSNIAATLAKLAMDVCLFLNQNFGFISFPDELTTGSSIMPHKKNPDVFELVRARCNSILALPHELALLLTNLSSGYHRDLQIIKEKLFPAFNTLHDCLAMCTLMLANIEVKADILNDPKYKYLFSVEEVNKLVLQGIPFREAYQKIGRDIEAGNFNPETTVHHTHEGSIGNLCNDEIKKAMQNAVDGFQFQIAHDALERLIL